MSADCTTGVMCFSLWGLDNLMTKPVEVLLAGDSSVYEIHTVSRRRNSGSGVKPSSVASRPTTSSHLACMCRCAIWTHSTPAESHISRLQLWLWQSC